MNILDKLNKKISLHQSPKLNWFTKRAWLYTMTHIAMGAMVFVGSILCIDSLHTTIAHSMDFVLKLLFILCSPVCAIALNILFFKYKYPLQEKVVKEYTERILQRFSKSEYQEIKIKLLKILNNELYTPVSFLDDIIQCKYRFDKQQNDKEYVNPVKEPLNLSVLIEKIEKDKNESLLETEISFQQWRKSISKM